MEHFVDISRVQVEQVAALMNSLEIHVLVDICGLHANGTTLYRTILARRPAGVQVACMALVAILHAYVLVAIMHAIMHACIPATVHTCRHAHALHMKVAYMAFAATTGASYVDYLATDSITSPPEYRA